MHAASRFLIALCYLPAVAGANELLTVYDRALTQDATLQAAGHARDAAAQAYPQARAALLPQLSAGYGYAYTDSETELQGQPPQTRDGTNRSLDVTLNQALFDWSAFQQLDQASQQVALADSQYLAARQDLALRVAQAYFGVLSANDTLRSATAENEAVGRQLEQAKERFEVGLSAITDVQEAQARFDLTVAQLIDAERAVQAANEALVEITGARAAGVSQLQDEIPLPAPAPADSAAWVDAAREGNLALLGSRYIVAAAEAGVKVARGAHLPTVGARASYSDSTSETGVFPADTTQESYGVQVTLPLFSGLAVQSRVHQARSTLEQRRSELDGTVRNVERQTRDAYQAVVAGAARTKALKQAVVSSRTALEASETGLEVGTRTAIDVLNAQQQLYLAERNYLQARYDYLLAVLTLKAVAGRLGRDDLAEIDALLVAAS
ncbi:TolC family outer membrane protein [Flagellatimonas centrodinii]|uniref:TolC family outer membrane protein n=1 Tax=Flagellatimonas centrodinii TaxID=2806210 RepID=UPI001FEE1CC1|nr:TolC family outer membrane protein [Flagellatimonas centrodinii]ULQ45630.1 TolC family outer membrane protein [Flagellatimonas centrodinii]